MRWRSQAGQTLPGVLGIFAFLVLIAGGVAAVLSSVLDREQRGLDDRRIYANLNPPNRLQVAAGSTASCGPTSGFVSLVYQSADPSQSNLSSVVACMTGPAQVTPGSETILFRQRAQLADDTWSPVTDSKGQATKLTLQSQSLIWFTAAWQGGSWGSAPDVCVVGEPVPNPPSTDNCSQVASICSPTLAPHPTGSPPQGSGVISQVMLICTPAATSKVYLYLRPRGDQNLSGVLTLRLAPVSTGASAASVVLQALAGGVGGAAYQEQDVLVAAAGARVDYEGPVG